MRGTLVSSAWPCGRSAWPSAASVAAWLAQHPAITVVCRDRSDLYADGICRGAPEAVQVVDRFHLVQNLRVRVEVPEPTAGEIGRRN